MPIKSKAQQRLMYAAASGKAQSADIPKSVAKRYIEETPSESYGKMLERSKAKRVVMKRKKGGK